MIERTPKIEGNCLNGHDLSVFIIMPPSVPPNAKSMEFGGKLPLP